MPRAQEPNDQGIGVRKYPETFAGQHSNELGPTSPCVPARCPSATAREVAQASQLHLATPVRKPVTVHFFQWNILE